MEGAFIDRTGTHKNCFIYERRLKDESMLVVINFHVAQTIVLKDQISEVLLSNYPLSSQLPKEEYQPYQAVVYRLI